MTPFVLKRVNELTKGRSLQASIHFFLLDLYLHPTSKCHMIMDVQCTCSISMQLKEDRDLTSGVSHCFILILKLEAVQYTCHCCLWEFVGTQPPQMAL